MVDIAVIALSLPEVEQSIACAGTKLESRTCRVRKRSFLFVSAKHLRLKLDASATEAKELSFSVGANGWITIPLDEVPAGPVIRRWIAESYALMLAPAAKTKSSKAKPGPKKR